MQIDGGREREAALKSDGTVWAWGYNGYGELGDNTTVDKHTPVQVSGLTGVTAIAGADFHSLALKSDGTVWAWAATATGSSGTTPRWTNIRQCRWAASPGSLPSTAAPATTRWRSRATAPSGPGATTAKASSGSATRRANIIRRRFR